ncbi:retrovirus-related pol polyprotein from transposon TNT 1-94 [Tanacetum coccineum]
MDCDVSWKAKLSTLHDENVLLKHQVESTVKERENIKLEFQKLFNSIKATRAQHQNEINEMFEDVTQKTYAYADVRAQNQDLLMTISELKSKLKTIDKGKHVNTKFDKSETLGKLLCVTPFKKNLAIKAKNMANTKVTSDRSKPVTSQSTPTIEQKQQHNANVIARGMYKINQEDTKTKDSKANTNVSNSTGVGSSNSVRRPKSKDNKSKNNVIQLVLWIVNSGCSKHMTGNLQLLRNFIEKFIGTIHFGMIISLQSQAIEIMFKDETPDMIIDFVNQVQRNLKASILTIRTDNETEFKNKTLRVFYANSIVHTWHNKTPHELIRGRKPNVQYFYVFGSLCYPINDRDDLRKMKPKADIGIFVGYSESSRGFRIYNRQTKKTMETIHVKFDELTAMASECNNLEPGMNCMNFNDSSENSQSVPSTSDLDNLFSPMYEEYYSMSSHEVSDNFAANTLDNDHTSSSLSIVVDQDDAPQIVSSSEDQVLTEPNSPVLNEVADEFVQEDVVDFDRHMFHNAPQTPEFDVAESSSTYQDP